MREGALEFLIWLGAVLTVAGLALLVWCIVRAIRTRRMQLDEPAMKAQLQKLVTINLAALALSALGLMSVVVGIVLT